jgi:two-component system nitrogen regulation sensor histidine kinase NtrY
MMMEEGRPEGRAPGTTPLQSMLHWARRVGLENKLAVLLSVAAIASGIATYVALTRNPPFGADADTVSALLGLNLVLLLLLGVIIARRIVALWLERRRGSAASRLHVRLVALFSGVAVGPAILVAAFSAVFFQIGVQSWFSERVRTAVNESLTVARAYLEEHQQNLRVAALIMASDISESAPQLRANNAVFNQFLTNQAVIRNVTEAMVLDGNNRLIARSALTLAPLFDPFSQEVLDRARAERVVILDSSTDDRVRALIRLDGFPDSFLLIGRMVEPTVIAHMERAQGAVAEYREVEGRRSVLQITFTLIYVLVALLLLLAAVWLGLAFADSLVTPLRRLINASERVREGDLSTRVADMGANDELGNLGRSFNRMTDQLESQRRDLIEANRQLDQRRQFTETVLAGVSAGVLGLDQEARINLPNKSATELLGLSVDELIGKPLDAALPEMASLLDKVRSRSRRIASGQVRIRRGAEARTLLVRIAAERLDGDVRGYVVTFDDVTELLAAQRKAAWADVARRIAHEIKNPLTPIQLSAERLKRRYLKQIVDDPATFTTCTDTIIRQVGDIGRMVDEFSAFARMPQPVMKPTDLSQTCQEALFLQRNAHPDITFEYVEPRNRPPVPCDTRQVSQAITNLLQNAVDAIEGRLQAEEPTSADPGRIVMRLVYSDAEMRVTIEDNGKGLPTADRDRLTEPYVTTRAKGTGLGLAIVKKIMEDHSGRLVLEDRPGGGARVSLLFPREQAVADAADPPRAVNED